ncbi:hypothetical protein Tco_1112831 [Tanacetum coccineum]|uniref:Uncharacterized protein n=1 Tax=Tanacetum coccineum TaxID=301880 RepID=A0ABQ5ITH4_9ASTR
MLSLLHRQDGENPVQNEWGKKGNSDALFLMASDHVKNVPQAAETTTTSNELDLLFSLMFNELINGTTQVVSNSSAVHAADASAKRQQQPDSTSYTSTLATSVTTNGNFDL